MSLLAARPWWEVADVLASDIEIATAFCTSLVLPISEIKALWLVDMAIFKIVQEQFTAWHRSGNERNECQNQALRRLQKAMQAFSKAFHGRKGDSAQAKYAEARLSSRRSLLENHNPFLDECPNS